MNRGTTVPVPFDNDPGEICLSSVSFRDRSVCLTRIMYIKTSLLLHQKVEEIEGYSETKERKKLFFLG